MFHAFLFKTKNYSPGAINIQLREEELNIVLPGVNNFNVKQKGRIGFIKCHQHQTRSGS